MGVPPVSKKSSRTDMPEWQESGYSKIWMPYTQMHTAPTPLAVKKTDGVRIFLEDGRELIDGVSSWWSVCHGYNHPHIVEAMQKQIAEMPHIMFAGLNHKPALKLAEILAEITPGDLSRSFFSDSGSVAVEVAMKMAVQYWQNKGVSHKNRFVSFRGAYHGDTMGAMSLCDPDGMHRAFSGYMPMQFVMDIPSDEYSFAEFDDALSAFSRQVAAVIIEPLVQCAGGFRFHSADTLAEIYRITKKHNLLFIADEAATGFGRTGEMFACDEASITPDIMVLAKALTGGHITLAATIATNEVFEAFQSEDMYKALMHGPTFKANPVACAAAVASLELFSREGSLQKVEFIENYLCGKLFELKSFDCVADVRVKGAIGVVELNEKAPDMWALRKAFVQQGIWLRPFGNILYIMPPFVISEDDLRAVCDAVFKVLQSK